MAKKAVKKETSENPVFLGGIVPSTGGVVISGGFAPVIPKTLISHMSVDFPNEGLNNLAKKVNEIIDHLNK